MGLSKERTAFRDMDFSSSSEPIDADGDRQKLPRVIKGGQVLPQPLSLEPIEMMAQEQKSPLEDPDIQVIKNNGIVEAVEVRCTCGHAIRLGLDYDLSAIEKG